MDPSSIAIIGGIALIILVAAVLLIWRSRSEGIIRVPSASASAPGLSDVPEAPFDLPDEALVPILQDSVRRSAEQALRRGHPLRRYIVRRGDRLFFTFESMPDPELRRRAYTAFRSVNTGQDVDIREVFEILRVMNKE
jgi:hypothetical protein